MRVWGQDLTERRCKVNDLVFLVDVDNTLLDNDEVRVHLEGMVADLIGTSRMKQFFEIY